MSLLFRVLQGRGFLEKGFFFRNAAYPALLFLFVLLASASSAQTPTPTSTPNCFPDTFGMTTIGSKAGNASNILDGTRYVCPQAGFAQSLSIYVNSQTGSPQLHGALYSDNAGLPQNLLAQSITVNAVGAS